MATLWLIDQAGTTVREILLILATHALEIGAPRKCMHEVPW